MKNRWLNCVLGESDQDAIPTNAEPEDSALTPPSPSGASADVESLPSNEVVNALKEAWQSGQRNDVAAQLLFTPVSYADFVRLCFQLGQPDAVELGEMLDQLAESEGMVTDVPGENKLLSKVGASKPEQPGEMIDTENT